MDNDLGGGAFALISLCTILMFVLGVALVIFGGVRSSRVRQLERSGQRTTGTVVDNQMESRTQGRMTFRPVVRFQTVAGSEFTVVTEQPSFRSHVVGTQVPIVYDLADPSRASVIGRGSGAAGFVVAGVLVMLFSICMLGFFVLAPQLA